MDKKNKTAKTLEQCFSELDCMKDAALSRIWEIKAVLELGNEYCFYTHSNGSKDIDWHSVFSLLSRLAEKAEDNLNEIDGSIYDCKQKTDELSKLISQGQEKVS